MIECMRMLFITGGSIRRSECHAVYIVLRYVWNTRKYSLATNTGKVICYDTVPISLIGFLGVGNLENDSRVIILAHLELMV